MKKILKFLFGALIIFCIQFFSICILKYAKISFPAPIFGIVILFLLLKLKLIKDEWIKEFCDFVLKYMILFFIPMFVGIIKYKEILVQSYLPIVLTIIITTPIVMICVALFIENAIKFKRLHNIRKVAKND